MEILKLLKELEKLIEGQKTLMGVTYNFAPDNFLVITNKIRAAMPELLSSEQIMEKTATVLTRHLRSQEEVTAVVAEIRAEARAV